MKSLQNILTTFAVAGLMSTGIADNNSLISDSNSQYNISHEKKSRYITKYDDSDSMGGVYKDGGFVINFSNVRKKDMPRPTQEKPLLDLSKKNVFLAEDILNLKYDQTINPMFNYIPFKSPTFYPDKPANIEFNTNFDTCKKSDKGMICEYFDDEKDIAYTFNYTDKMNYLSVIVRKGDASFRIYTQDNNFDNENDGASIFADFHKRKLDLNNSEDLSTFLSLMNAYSVISKEYNNK